MSDNKVPSPINSENVLKDITDSHVEISQGKLSHTFTSNPPHFGTEPIGRGRLIKDGIRMLKNEKLLVLMGMGGIGKTKIAKEIYYNAKGYRYKGWVEYSDEKGIVCSVVDAMEFKCGLNFPENSTVYEKFAVIEKALNNTLGRVLIVVDNLNNKMADDKLLSRLFGLAGCDILITSRCNLTDDSRTMQVAFLEEKDCLKLFYKHYAVEKDNAIAKEIVKLAGYHTITVELLAKMADTARLKIVDFAEKLKEQSFDLHDVIEQVKTEKDSEATEKALYAHLVKLFAIDDLTEDEQKLLANASLITKFPIIKSDARDVLSIRGYSELNGLIDKGWLMQTEDDDEPRLQMHHVVLSAVQKKYEIKLEDDALSIVEKVAKKLEWSEEGSYSDLLGYMPMALDVYERFCDLEAWEVGALTNNIAIVYGDKQDYKKALMYYKKAFDITIKTMGKESPNSALTYNNIARAHKELCEYDEALKNYKLAIDIGEKTIGENHIFMLESYKAISWVYVLKKEYDEAEKYYEKALAISENLFGEQHPATVEIYNNIAGVYSKLEKYDKSLEIMQKSLKASVKIFGEDHIETALAYNNIANAYFSNKEYDKAMKNYKKALEIRIKTFGDNHPVTARTNYNIAGIYYVKKEYYEALEYYEKALDTQRKCLGNSHYDTGATYYNIGIIYHIRKDYDSALEYYINGVKSFIASIGKDDEYTKHAFSNTEKAYLASDLPEAEYDDWLKGQLEG